MLVDTATFLPCSPQQAIERVKSPDLLCYVAAPLVTFTPVAPPEFPSTWEEGTYWVSLKLFGVLPLGRQAVVVSYPETSDGFSMRDNGYSAMIKRWEHSITIKASGDGTLYRDRIRVEAGVLTAVVWVFVHIFFAHRQRRWRRLVARGFDQGTVSSR